MHCGASRGTVTVAVTVPWLTDRPTVVIFIVAVVPGTVFCSCLILLEPEASEGRL